MTTPDLPAVPLTLRLLGPFEMRVHGAPLPHLRTRKGAWLLALLTLRPGHEADRAWLAGMLWPESLQTQALASLRKSLKDLRRALGREAGRLHAPTPRSLALDLSGATVDLIAFDAGVARGDIISLEEAVAIYRGPLLEGCGEAWLLPERQAREDAYLGALETLARAGLANGDLSAAESYLRRAAALDPLRESAHRGLMELLAAGGNYAAALLVYRELRLRLHRELHAAPDPETQALFQRLRTEARETGRTTLRAVPRFAWSWRDVDGATGPVSGPFPVAHSPSRALAFSLQRDRRFNVSPPGNLPTPPTPLIGREHDAATARALLIRKDARLMTLTGPAGIGKTRLALQVATELRDDFPGGVFLVELASIRDPNRVSAAICQTLGVREGGDKPLRESLKAYLRDKQLLLLLDNFEHVLAAAPVVAELLAAAPRLKVLVTSRAVLHLRGEKEFSVPPLALPPVGASLADAHPGLEGQPQAMPLQQYAAVELFIQRALDVKPDFAVTNENAPAVAEICHRLDGLPLAIELAAARVKLFAPESLLSRLVAPRGACSRLKLLIGGARDLPARQQTLRSAIAWSYDLLEEPEKTLFRRLSVFAGGCTLQAAEAVVSGQWSVASESGTPIQLTTDHWPLTTDDVLDLLGSLVDKSMLHQEEHANGETRLRMLETIREYGQEQLEASGEGPALRKQHADFFTAWAEEAEPKLWTQVAWLDRLETEHHNLRAALDWCAGQRPETGLRLAGALWWFWDIRGHHTEARQRLATALAWSTGVESAVRRKALCAAAYLGDNEQALARGAESMALCRQAGDRSGMAWSLMALMSVAWRQGDWARTGALAAEALSLFRETEDTRGIACAMSRLGWTEWLQGHREQGRPLMEDGLALCRSAGYRWLCAGNLSQLALAALEAGHLERARTLLEESLTIAREFGRRSASAYALHALARVAQATGEDAQATTLFEESLSLAREVGNASGSARTLLALGQHLLSRGEHERAKASFGQARASFQEQDNKGRIALSVLGLASVAQAQGDPQTARALFEEALPPGREVEDGSRSEICMAQAELLLELGEYAAARSRYEEGLTLRRSGENPWLIAQALLQVGHAAWCQGESTAAQRHAVEALELFREGEDQDGVLAALESLAVAALTQGRKERAARLLGAVEALREALGLPGAPWWRRPRARMEEAVRAASLEQEFPVAWGAGQAVPLDEALAEALEA